MELTIKKKEEIMIYLYRYSVDMVSTVLDIPLLWVRSVYIEYKSMSSKKKLKLHRSMRGNKFVKKGLSKLKKEAKKDELRQFYDNDVVMAKLDGIRI